MANSTTGTKRWYAVYTRPRSEKSADKQLSEKNIQTFLPLQKRLKQWSDRKKWVEEPLFRSYIFVYIDPRMTLPVLEVPGVVRFVKFEQQPVAIPERQIEAVRKLLNSEEQFEVSNESFPKGMAVEVMQGPLRGVTGTVTQQKGKYKLVITIEAIHQTLLVTVPKSILKKNI